MRTLELCKSSVERFPAVSLSEQRSARSSPAASLSERRTRFAQAVQEPVADQDLQTFLPGNKVTTELDELTDKFTDAILGIDRRSDSTPTLDFEHGIFGGPSVDVTPGPFDFMQESCYLEQTVREKLEGLKDVKQESRMNTRKSSSTTEELEELRTWASEYNEARGKQNAGYQHSQNFDHSARLSCDENDLQFVFSKFIESETPELEGGITLLLQNIPHDFRYEPDISDMIKSSASIDSIDYIYLPVAVDRPSLNEFRNKGYCFIHFSDANMAQKFMDGISEYKAFDRTRASTCANNTHPDGKLSAVFAKFQGLSTNLHNLIDIESKKWRPKKGFVRVRTNSGLSNISLFGLRELAKQHANTLDEHSRLDHDAANPAWLCRA
jgi:hypothetical protein